MPEPFNTPEFESITKGKRGGRQRGMCSHPGCTELNELSIIVRVMETYHQGRKSRRSITRNRSFCTQHAGEMYQHLIKELYG